FNPSAHRSWRGPPSTSVRCGRVPSLAADPDLGVSALSTRDPWPLADDGDTRILRRREHTHALCAALCPPLVQPVEREVVRRILADDGATAGASVDCSVLTFHEHLDGLHDGATHRHHAAAGRRLSFLTLLGRRSLRDAGRDHQYLPRIVGSAGLPGWAAADRAGDRT